MNRGRGHALGPEIFAPKTLVISWLTMAASVYCSTLFRFSIEDQTFYIHADLASRLSKPLERLINGPMREAGEGTAKLESVTPETFERYIQWAYKGYYTAPAPSVHDDKDGSTGSRVPGSASQEYQDVMVEETVVNEMEPAVAPDKDQSGFFGYTVHYTEQRKQSKKNRFQYYKIDNGKGNLLPDLEETAGSTASARSIRQTFIDRKPLVRRNSVDVPPPRANKDRAEDYTQVFLCHAELYIFAERYDIQSLKTLALDELHATLAIFTLFDERTRDIIELLRYTYENTADSKNANEDLRSLLTHYIGFEMDTLIKDPDFKDLMIRDGAAGGNLLGDFLSVVSKRIS